MGRSDNGGGGPSGKRNSGWDAARVSALREKLGMSRKQMADQLGVHWQTLARWEQGYFLPSLMAGDSLDQLEASSRAGRS